MRIFNLIFAVAAALAVAAQDTVRPEVVRLENLRLDGDMRVVYVGTATKHWVLFCNVEAAGCISPQADRNYLLFDAQTRWKMPGAKEFMTLSFMQDWTVKYNQGENIGLIPQDGKGDFGVFILDREGGGYEQDTILTDGPIVYGTGMNEKDRHNAWKHFFYMIVEAATRQQGKDAVAVKLATRCLPNQPFCTNALDAMLVGIAGIQEPRKVVVTVASDAHDQKKMIERIVCTWPTNDKQVCRDWDTGKLLTGEMFKSAK